MRFAHIAADPGELSKWHDHETGFRAQLRFVPTAEYEQVVRRFRLGTDKADAKGYRSYVAQRWFLDFQNAYNAQGDPIENTLEMRKAILEDPGMYVWIIERLNDSAQWWAEGNGSSGSAS